MSNPYIDQRSLKPIASYPQSHEISAQYPPLSDAKNNYHVKPYRYKSEAEEWVAAASIGTNGYIQGFEPMALDPRFDYGA